MQDEIQCPTLPEVTLYKITSTCILHLLTTDPNPH